MRTEQSTNGETLTLQLCISMFILASSIDIRISDCDSTYTVSELWAMSKLRHGRVIEETADVIEQGHSA